MGGEASAETRRTFLLGMVNIAVARALVPIADEV